MEPFTRVTGVLAPLDRANVDTDQIIPKQFLKRIERSGYGPFLFYDWRREGHFILDRPEHRGASVLVTGPNFGCGSSREHAAWSLLDAGIRVVIAPTFADIFKSNSFRCGLLPVELPEPVVRELMDLALNKPGTRITVDLEAQRLTTSFAFPQGEGHFDSPPAGGNLDSPPRLGERGFGSPLPLGEGRVGAVFTIDPFFRDCLLNGWDEIALTLRHGEDIARYEATRSKFLPAAG